MSSYDWLATFLGPGIVLLFFGVLFLLVTYLLVKTSRSLHALTLFLNLVTLSLVAISCLNVGAYWFTEAGTREGSPDLVKAVQPLPKEERPNIYYIILDGYGRADMLKEIYGHNNNELLDYLVGKGFYVADNSYSNYNQTGLSLASSLNLHYLDHLMVHLDETSDNRIPLRNLIQDNNVSTFLKQQGYTFVAFSSGYFFTEIKAADIVLSDSWSLSEFQNTLLGTTPIPVILNQFAPALSQNDLHRNRILYIFEELAHPPEIVPPIFVFAHILAPHPPFVFGENGEPINDDRVFSILDGSHYTDEFKEGRAEYIANYKRQLTFINKQLIKTVDAILANSPTPPVIIIQGDHGPGSKLAWENPNDTNTDYRERMAILNAYYFPEANHALLYEEISPVNSFRVVFNHYFGTDYPLLEDNAYFSSWSQPYKFIDVNDKIK